MLELQGNLLCIVGVGIVPLDVDAQGGIGPHVPAGDRIGERQALENLADVDPRIPIMAGVDDVLVPVVGGEPRSRVRTVAGADFQILFRAGLELYRHGHPAFPGLFFVRFDADVGKTVRQGKIPLGLGDLFVRKDAPLPEVHKPVQKSPGISRRPGKTYRPEVIAGTGLIDQFDIRRQFRPVHPDFLGPETAVQIAPADAGVMDAPLCLFIDLMTEDRPRRQGKLLRLLPEILFILPRPLDADNGAAHPHRRPPRHGDDQPHLPRRRGFPEDLRLDPVITERFQGLSHPAGKLLLKVVQPDLVDPAVFYQSFGNLEGRPDVPEFISLQPPDLHRH